jgi:ABC-type sugar transport system substrate-binding protein
MNKLRFVVSLTTRDNDYQVEQAAVAEHTANRLGAEVEILYAENDAIQQSQQLLRIIQSSTVLPAGIIFEPVGATGLPQVAKVAVAAGVGWVVLNRRVEYLSDLRHSYRVPVFSISSDHEEIGRIQAEQLAAVLPQGGNVLLIQGSGEFSGAQERLNGLLESKPANIQVRVTKSDWTEQGAYKAVRSWLTLSTSRRDQLDLVVSQNDAMAIGARKAFQEITENDVRARFSHLLYLGVDAVRTTGQEWLKRGLLAGTVVVPTNTDIAIEMLATSIRTGENPPESNRTVPKALPSIEQLRAKRVRATNP